MKFRPNDACPDPDLLPRSYLWFALQNLRLRELAVSGREVDLAVLPDSLQRLAIRADVVRSPHALARLSRLVSLDLVVGQDEQQSKVAAVRCGEVYLLWIFWLL